jgi:hypothetical protein
MLGHTDYDFFPKEQADWFREKDVEMFTLGQRVEITEEPITDKDGHQHTLSTSKVPLRDASGVITHLVGIIHDITPLKRAEEALREVTSALELRMQERTNDLLEAQTELVRRERLAVIGLFAGTLAHQIRNPLGSIKNAAYLVQLAVPTMDDDLRRALAIIQDEVARANQIITDLVDYARVSSAQRRVVPVDLLMEIALSGMDLPTNVTIHIECPPLPKVFVDPSQLQRALQKLVKNALQSMSNGGTLTLSAHADGDAVFFAVTDTGKGIPDDVRQPPLRAARQRQPRQPRPRAHHRPRPRREPGRRPRAREERPRGHPRGAAPPGRPSRPLRARSTRRAGPRCRPRAASALAGSTHRAPSSTRFPRATSLATAASRPAIGSTPVRAESVARSTPAAVRSPSISPSCTRTSGAIASVSPGGSSPRSRASQYAAASAWLRHRSPARPSVGAAVQPTAPAPRPRYHSPLQ